MADISYSVEAVLKLSGDGAFQSGMGAAASAADRLQTSLGQAYSGAKSLGGGLVETAERAAGVVARIGAIGLAAGTALGGAAAHAIGENLKMLEDKGIQLSAIVSAATGQAFDEARVASDKLFADFKRDAVVSAGETADFVDIASKIGPAILGAGKSMEDLRTVTKGVVAMAPAVGVAFDQAGSDIMRMLQGQAGAELPMFQKFQALTRLGIPAAKEFNALAPDKRFALISKALNDPAFKAASDAAGGSMSGLLSTVSDQLKTLGGLVGGPTYELIKTRLTKMTSGLMDGIGENGTVSRAATALGLVIANRFGEMERVILRLFPNVNEQAGGVLDTITRLADAGLGKIVQVSSYLVDHWPQIVSSAKEFAYAIGNAVERAGELLRTLGGGDMAKGLERAALLYGGGKTAAGAAPMVGNALDMGKGLYGAGKSALEMFGGSAAEAAAGSGATGAAAKAAAAAAPKSASLLAAEKASAPFFLGSGSATAGFMEMVELPAQAASATASVGALGAAMIVIAGVAATLGEVFLVLKSRVLTVGEYVEQRFETAKNAAKPLMDSIDKLSTSWGHVWESVERLWKSLEPFRMLLTNVLSVVVLFNPLVAGVVGALLLVSTAAEPAVRVLTEIADALNSFAAIVTKAMNSVTEFVDSVAVKLESMYGLRRKHADLDPTDDTYEKRGEFGVRMGVLDMRATNGLPTTNRAQPPANKGGGKVEVVLKWDLGDGDDAAIYVRNRQQIRDMTTRARGFVRSGKAPGLF